MSWFTDLAGKAENILNKIDQNAATVLQQSATTKALHSEKEILIDRKPEPSSNTTPIKRTQSAKKLLLKPNPDDDLDDLVSDDRRSVNSMSRGSSSSRAADEATSVIEMPQTSVSSSFLSSMSGTIGFEQELAAMKIVLSEVKLERDDLKAELESVLTQLKAMNKQSLIDELGDKCEQLTAEKEMLADKIENLERSNENYVKSISDLELKLSKSQQSESDLSNKLEWAKRECEQTATELQQYRSRAQSTLQMKDKIIEQLKQKDHASDATISANRINSFEIENLNAEKNALLEEIRVQGEQLEEIRRYVEKLENVQRDQEMEFDKRVNVLNGNLRLEETKWMQYETENKLQMKELSSVKDEMKRLQIEYGNKIREKESELLQLRTKLAQRSSSPQPSFGLEERVQSLTQSLVQKQTSLENITADRNALRIQLEKIETQHRNTMLQLRQQRPQIININDTDDAKAQVPNFLQENPFDTDVARRVKRAYSNLDSMGIRLGVFFRRYPLVRILVIFYVALLHLWVLFVLVTSTPSS
ncbi:Golgin-84 [Pseudolycoriella hygida]|uniref:Golgin-84 n=1 Tax=Pseudolycoriella hygida TaxID=35572 RepID=A0A9Q0RXN6_9DIPT|nr:Golgin-84 [Pseudolycoriella hygida]